MKYSRFIAILLCLCLLPGLTFPAAADEIEESGLAQAIIRSCTYGETVDISDQQIDHAAFDTLFDQLYYSGQLPWYTSSAYTYQYNPDTGILQSFTPSKILEGAVDTAAYEETVAQILNACVYDGMEQWQIALSIHDYLIANTTYDLTLEKNTGYDILVNKSAVCEGYTFAYMDLMLRAGIPCVYIASDAMDHCWNLVCIDDIWYHVDVTWDDPTPNVPGYVDHKYFLLTDEEISAGDEPHHDWVSPITCTNTRFTDGFWRQTKSQIIYKERDTCYYLRSIDWQSHIYRRQNNTDALIYKEDKASVNIGAGNYFYGHLGLSLRGGRLWFNTPKKLLSMNMDGSGVKTEYTHSGNTYLYTCYVSGDRATLELSAHDGTLSRQEIDLPPAEDHIHNYSRTVTEPNCTTNGFTESVCSCGLTAKSAPTQATGHNYFQTDGKTPWLLSEGFATYTCSDCNDSYTQQLPKVDLGEFLQENARLIALVTVAVISLIGKLTSRKKRRNS